MKVQTLARAIFQRFPDPGLERRYRHEQRLRQARFIRAAALIAAAVTVANWSLQFSQLETGPAAQVQAVQALYAPILLPYAWFVGRPAYAEGWWVDVALFAVIQVVIYWTVELLTRGGGTGWPFYAHLCFAMQVALVFACIVIVAAFAAYVALALGTVAWLFFVLVSRDYDASIVAFTGVSYAGFAGLMIFVSWVIDAKARSVFAARVSLDAEREKSEALLGNMLPAPIAERLKAHEAVADGFDEIVVVFVDLVGFTTLAQQLGPARIVELLNAFFSRADHGTDLFALEKVKTIGDAYMAVAGALTKPPRPAKAAVDFAVWLRSQARDVGRGFGVDLRIHIGIASGPAIGGVTGSKRLSYDYWGHTVNLAARLQDAAAGNGIAVSEAVFTAVRTSYPFLEPREIQLKGVGATPIYDLDLRSD